MAFDTESVEAMADGLRLPDIDNATAQASVILHSLRTQPERWPRARLDSLSARAVDVILTDSPYPAHGLLVSILVADGGDGLAVGTFEQLRLLAEAGLRNTPKAYVLQRMGRFGDRPEALAYLSAIATQPEQGHLDIDPVSAICALTQSSLGRQRLGVLWRDNEIRGSRARRFMERLPDLDFHRSPELDASCAT